MAPDGNATQHATQIEHGHTAPVYVRQRSVCVNAAVEVNVLDYNVAVRQRMSTYVAVRSVIVRVRLQ